MNLKRAWFKPQGVERISRNPRLANRRTIGGKYPLIGPTRRIPEIREALGLTQAQLAAALGIRSSMLANLESGRYAAHVSVGIRMYLYFATIAAQKQLTPLCLEAKRDVRRFIDFQRGLNAKAIRQAEGERKKRMAIEKQLAEEEAKLANI